MKVIQKFLGKEVTRTKVIKNILRYYNLCTQEEIESGKNWYKEANVFCQELADQHKLEVWKVAGVVSALSPQTSWEMNKTFAKEFIAKGGRGFMGNRDRTIKAKKILKASNGDEVHDLLSTKPGKALKTKAFFRNISMPGFCDTTCIDRHALAVATQKPDNTRALSNKEGSITEKQYRFLSTCYIEASKKVKIIPSELQAITWNKYRECRGLSKPTSAGDFIPMNIESF